MTKPLAMGRALRLFAGATLVVVVGCGKGEQKGEQSRASGTGTDSTPKALASTVSASQPGALPQALEKMSGEDLYSFTRQLSFGGGHERERRCRGRAGCRGQRPVDSTKIQIDAVEKEDSLSAGTLSSNGVIAARLLNRGTLADSMYNTQPGPQFEYYLVVLPQGQGLATWSLVELNTTPGGRIHRTIGTGRFKSCNHTFRRGARADFKTCAQAASMSNVSFRGMMQSEEDGPIWVACAGGCCTADPPDGAM